MTCVLAPPLRAGLLQGSVKSGCCNARGKVISPWHCTTLCSESQTIAAPHWRPERFYAQQCMDLLY